MKDPVGPDGATTGGLGPEGGTGPFLAAGRGGGGGAGAEEEKIKDMTDRSSGRFLEVSLMQAPSGIVKIAGW